MPNAKTRPLRRPRCSRKDSTSFSVATKSSTRRCSSKASERLKNIDLMITERKKERKNSKIKHIDFFVFCIAQSSFLLGIYLSTQATKRSLNRCVENFSDCLMPFFTSTSKQSALSKKASASAYSSSLSAKSPHSSVGCLF